MTRKRFLVFWLAAFLSPLAAVNVHAANILANPSFDEGIAPWEPPGWWSGGAGDSLVDERGRFCTTVSALGDFDWGAQLRQVGLSFNAGESYDVSLRAWSSTAVNLSMSATDESDGFVWIFGSDIAIDAPLDGDGQLLAMNFTASADTDTGTFRFLMGGGNVPVDQTVCFDDIVVDAPVPNLIQNSTFDDGYAPWLLSESGGVAVPSAADGRFCVLVEDPGSNPWDVQVRAEGLGFVNDGEYAFSADTWSSAAVSIEVTGVDESEGFVWHFGQEVAIDAPLDGEPQRLEINFLNSAGDTDSGAFRFLLGDGHVAAGTSVCFDNVELLDLNGAEPPEEEPTPPLHVNSHGYSTELNKRATYVPPADAVDVTAPRSWTLLSGEVSVASGMTRYHGFDEGSGDYVHVIDFSDVQIAADNYTIAVDEGESAHISAAFVIGDNIYASLKYDALSYFYHNRAGTPILAEIVGETWARPAGHVGDSAVQTIECLTDPGSEFCRTLDSSGGWYDAGDHGKYVVNGGISVWTLLNQYERALALGGDLAQFADGAMALPAEEAGNGIPDILDEARWEIEWFLKMQIPADFPLAGMVHHKMHSEYWTGLPTAPDTDEVSRYVHPPSTAATLNFAAVTAQCYRVFKAFDPEFAETCLDAAQVAYAAAKANDFIPATDNGNGGGTYGDGNVTDEFYWAASELYLSTARSKPRWDKRPSKRGFGDSDRGDRRKVYAQDMLASAHHLNAGEGQSIMGWGTTHALGLISLATVGPLHNADESWVDEARQALIGAADLFVGHTNTQGYGVPMWTGQMYWGSNSAVTNNMLVLGLAHDFTCDDSYLNSMQSGMDYLMGNNPLGVSYVSGYGERDMKEPHHRFWANVLNSDFPLPPPGVVAGGPNSLLQDPIAESLLQGCSPLKCYIDHWDSYSTNEVTINWNAPLAWAAAYLDQWSDPQLKQAAQSRCALRNQHFTSFEDDSRVWSERGPAQISVVGGGTRGDSALQVEGCGYSRVLSPEFSTAEFEILGDSIAVDMWLPEEQSNPYWRGDIGFHLSVPDANIRNMWIGGTSLRGSPLGEWFTASVKLPRAAQAVFAKEHTATLTLVLNTKNCAAPLLLDNLRLVENTRGR